jgi:hypothetical protein
MEKIFDSILLSKLFMTLFENRVCIRCILRIMKVENIHYYRVKTNYTEILYRVG